MDRKKCGKTQDKSVDCCLTKARDDGCWLAAGSSSESDEIYLGYIFNAVSFSKIKNVGNNRNVC